MTPKQLAERNTSQRAGLSPVSVEVLSANIRSPLFNSEYGLRHPSAIYSVSLDKILKSFENLFKQLEIASQIDLKSKKLDPNWDNDLLQNLERLLYSMMEHMDDCESILQCFFPLETKLAKNPQIKNYSNSIGTYRTHIGKITNHIKHKQGRIRSIALYLGNTPQFGYFVEGPDKDGSLGPAPHIHTGGGSAFSYARDIRLHVHALYYISQQLAEAILSIANIDLSQPSVPLNNDKNYRDLINSAINLPMVVFPNEISKEFPYISLSEEKENINKLTLALKLHPHGLKTIPYSMEIITFYKTDGITQAYRMPYRN